MIQWKRTLALLFLGFCLVLSGCAGESGVFTGRVEEISDWSLVARDLEEEQAYTFWARETKLDFLGLGDVVRITYRGKLEEGKPLSIVSVEKAEKGKNSEDAVFSPGFLWYDGVEKSHTKPKEEMP